MYVKSIPFKDFNGKPRNETIHLNLTEREVFKLLVELQSIFSWRDSLQGQDVRELPTEEVVEFYNNLEKVLLDAWGVPSEDGLHFRKAGRYEFEESALFNATMVSFISDPQEAGKMLDGIMPQGMTEIVQKAEGNLEAAANAATDEDQKATIARLQAQLASAKASDTPNNVTPIS